MIIDYGSLIQAGVNLVGAMEAGKLTAEQFALLKKQLADMAGIPLPQLEQVIATHRGPSAMSQIPQDAALRSKQMESLGGLQDIIDQGGMTLDDRVAQEEAMSRAAGADRSTRAGIASDLQQRGQLDSGANLVLQGQAAQSNMNANRQSGMEAAAAAQHRKLQALDDVSRTAGSVRGQDFSEASAKAAAQDQIDAWNAGSAEKANYYNAGLPQQQFNNQMQKASGQAGASNNLAGAYGNEAQGVRNQFAGYGQALGQGVNSATNSHGQNGNSYDPSTQNGYGPGGGAPPYQDVNPLNTTPQYQTTNEEEWKKWGSS